MDSDFVVGINKSIDAAKGETGQTYPAYLHNTLVTKKLDELAEAITEGGGGASALSDLEDVDISGTVQGGKVLKYNAVEEKWAPGDDSGNVQSDWNESDPASGAYILHKPTIPAAQVQADWNESDTSDPSYIQNKPNISNIISGTTDPAANIGDNGDIYLKKELTISQEQIDINYSHVNDGTTTTITVSENNTVIYTNTVNNVQQGDLDARYAGFDEVTANVTSLGGVTFIFKYRGVTVNASPSTCFFTSFNDGEETGWTMNGNSSAPHNETKTFNVPSGFIVSEIFLKDNNKWIAYKQDQVQADWNESDTSDPAFIKNKPAALVGCTMGVRRYMDSYETTITITYNSAVVYTKKINAGNMWGNFDSITETFTVGGAVNTITMYGDGTNDDRAQNWLHITLNDLHYDLGNTVRNPSYPLNLSVETAIKTGGKVQADWNETNQSSDAFIKNKPTIPDVSTKMDRVNASGVGSFSLNRAANTTIGNNSFAEGNICTASGTQSHAEGLQTVASGASSHAEGVYATASGNESHAEGMSTTASGDNSHAEGMETTASGDNSHAEGNHTIAAGDNQHVSGKYNIEDSNDTYAEIVGNGTSNNIRSNARTLDWSGNESLAGNIDAAGFGSRLAALVPNSYIELTQAEYDALTPAEKMSDTPYLITDANGDGSQFQPVIYSTSEREIGVWTDGKPLYEKTLFFSNLRTGQNKINHNISDFDTIFLKDFFFVRSDGVSIVGQEMDVDYLATVISVSSTKLTYNLGDNWGNVTGLYATVQYTKSTDTAGSGIWTPQGVPAVHYSTDEQVVGTWIDGSTLYEKTFTGLSLSTGTSWTDTGILMADYSIDKLISCEARDTKQTFPAAVGTWEHDTKVAIYLFVANRTINSLTLRYTKSST